VYNTAMTHKRLSMKTKVKKVSIEMTLKNGEVCNAANVCKMTVHKITEQASDTPLGTLCTKDLTSLGARCHLGQDTGCQATYTHCSEADAIASSRHRAHIGTHTHTTVLRLYGFCPGQPG